jgi:hypothetical protein
MSLYPSNYAGSQEPAERSGQRYPSWSRLNQFVHSLIDRHEPKGDQQAELRSDLRIMVLSGLGSYDSNCATQRECRQASAIMSELARHLPRIKSSPVHF